MSAFTPPPRGSLFRFEPQIQPATLVDNLRDANFDAEHEGLYLAFVAEAQRVKREGFKHYSARTIVHDLRHRTCVTDGSLLWKIDNRVSPFLARRLMREKPAEFGSWFETRKSAADGEGA